MKTRKQKETNEKEIHLLEHKGYERMMNEIMPVQQAEVYRKPTKKVVEEAVKELNPDTNSLGSRGRIHPLSFMIVLEVNLFKKRFLLKIIKNIIASILLKRREKL